MNEKTLVSAAITACVAQLVEQRIRNAQVAGSSPVASSIDPSEKSEGFLLYLSKFTHAYGPYRRAGCPHPAVSLDFSPPKSESFLFSPSKTGGIGGLRAARPTGFGRDFEKRCISPALRVPGGITLTPLPSAPRRRRQRTASVPLFRRRCATACPRAPDRRRARYRTRAAPCPPARWSAAGAPCTARR